MSIFLGKKFGKFTIKRDAGAQYECECACGRAEFVSKSITKPSYKGRRMCAWCAGSACVVCGVIIPAKPGQRAATCSKACAAQHIKIRGKDYYRRVKDSPAYKETHARAVESYKQRMQTDPEFFKVWRAYYRHQNLLERQRINADPALRESYLASKREYYRIWRDRIMSDPGGWEALKFKARKWYASLSDDDKKRIYIEPAKSKRHRSKIEERAAHEVKLRAAIAGCR